MEDDDDEKMEMETLDGEFPFLPSPKTHCETGVALETRPKPLIASILFKTFFHPKKTLREKYLGK